jgi:hypothetical protein
VDILIRKGEEVSGRLTTVFAALGCIVGPIRTPVIIVRFSAHHPNDTVNGNIDTNRDLKGRKLQRCIISLCPLSLMPE